MIPANELKLQRGGLWTAVQPCNRANPYHRRLLKGILLETIQHEAKVHDAKFDAEGFGNVMHALLSGDVEILFLVAAWDVAKPKVVGAAINFRSLFLQRKGQDITEDDGIYSEDVCMLPKMLRLLVAEKPFGARFPIGGLGAHFIRECIRYFAEQGMKGGIKPAGQRFEFLPDNTNIVKIQEQLGAVLGADFDNSGLMRFDGITDRIRNAWDMPVEVLSVRSADGSIDPHNFLLRWAGHNERQKIHAGFTRGVRTFVGQSITQSQIVSSGELLRTACRACALASACLYR